MKLINFYFNAIAKGVLALTGDTYRPQVLIADAAAAITNGFCAAYSYETIV